MSRQFIPTIQIYEKYVDFSLTIFHNIGYCLRERKRGLFVHYMDLVVTPKTWCLERERDIYIEREREKERYIYIEREKERKRDRDIYIYRER